MQEHIHDLHQWAQEVNVGEKASQYQKQQQQHQQYQKRKEEQKKKKEAFRAEEEKDDAEELKDLEKREGEKSEYNRAQGVGIPAWIAYNIPSSLRYNDSLRPPTTHLPIKIKGLQRGVSSIKRWQS